jgi:integrase
MSKGKTERLQPENNNGTIRIRFTYQQKRLSWSLQRAYTEENLSKLRHILHWIEMDIQAGTLDLSKEKYGIVVKKAPAAVQTSLFKDPYAPVSGVELKRLFASWTTEVRQMDVELDCDYRAIMSIMERWKKFDSSQMLSLLNKEPWSDYTFNKRLGMLKQFTKWLYRKKHLSEDILEDVVNRKKNKHQQHPDHDLIVGKRDPFQDNEIVKILDAFYNNTYSSKYAQPKDSYYYPFVYFIFRTGVRNAEAIGLKVRDVDFEQKRIFIRRSLPRQYQKVQLPDGSIKVQYLRKEKLPKKGSTNPYYQRDFFLAEDLSKILEPLTMNSQPEDLVFRSPRSNGPINDQNFQKRVFYRVLQELKLPKRNLYACRHTVITRSIDKGHQIEKLAQLVGNSPKMIERVYLHRLNTDEDFPMWES